MALFPKGELTILRIFQCPMCNQDWIEGHRFHCPAKSHLPGTCCHNGDTKLPTHAMQEIENITNRVRCSGK